MKAKVPAWIRSDQTLMIRLFAPNAAAYLTSFAIRISIDRAYRTWSERFQCKYSPIRIDDTPYFIDDLNNPHYSFTVDEGSLDVKMSVIK